MTSSLVGSEMCIRDSCCHLGDPRFAAKGYLLRFGGGRLVRAGVACQISVSYTHLTLPTICSV
eukprot:7484069-Prorocentrum_lima.AAC.1